MIQSVYVCIIINIKYITLTTDFNAITNNHKYHVELNNLMPSKIAFAQQHTNELQNDFWQYISTQQSITIT